MDVCPTCKRASSDLSLRDVAAATGVSFSTVGRFLRGRAVNSFALDAIEAFLDLDEPDHG
jgi:transcriptional regulator with XRE-family HTH domain